MATEAHLGTRLIHEIGTWNYATANFPLNRELDEGFDHFTRVLELSPQFREELHFLLEKDISGTDVGFVRRLEKDGHDNKEFFHYHPSFDERFKYLLGEVPVLDNFLQSARIIHDMVKVTAAQVFSALDDEIPGIYEQFFDCYELKEPNFFLRFLRYDVASQGNFIAKNHHDIGAFTIAIRESGPGLQIGTDDEDLQSVAYHPGSVLFFKGLQPVEGAGAISRPAWHGAVQEAEGGTRLAMVAFLDVLDRQPINRDHIYIPAKYW